MPVPVATSRRKQPLHIVLFGAPGTGKTENLVTASEFCPVAYTFADTKANRTLAEPVELSDMLWLTHEPGATQGFEQRNIIVPEIDLTAIPVSTWEKDIKDVHATIRARVAKGDTKVVVSDTITMMSHTIEMVVAHSYPSLEGQQYWGKVAELHSDWFLPLVGINATFFHLAHAKESAKVMGQGESAQAQRSAQDLKKKAWGLADISMDVPGKAKSLYRGAAALILWAYKGTEQAGGKPTLGWYYKSEDASLDVKRRLNVPAVLPQDWRVIKKMLTGGGQ